MSHEKSSKGEVLIRMVNEHWIKYVFPVFLYVVLLCVSVLIFLFAGYTAHHSMWLSHSAFVVALILLLLTHHWFFVVMLGELTTHIIITNHRVIRLREYVLFGEEMMEVSFEKMKTVAVKKRGILQVLLRYGTLQFESGAKISRVPHPNSVVKNIEQAMGLR